MQCSKIKTNNLILTLCDFHKSRVNVPFKVLSIIEGECGECKHTMNNLTQNTTPSVKCQTCQQDIPLEIARKHFHEKTKVIHFKVACYMDIDTGMCVEP